MQALFRATAVLLTLQLIQTSAFGGPFFQGWRRRHSPAPVCSRYVNYQPMPCVIYHTTTSCGGCAATVSNACVPIATGEQRTESPPKHLRIQDPFVPEGYVDVPQ